MNMNDPEKYLAWYGFISIFLILAHPVIMHGPSLSIQRVLTHVIVS